MEQEHFLTGYCRAIDQSRMVTAVTEGQALTEVDCGFENCIYAPSCTVAQQLRALLDDPS